MGGSSQSTSTNGIFARAMTNVLMQSSQNCTNSALNIQSILFKDLDISGCSVNFDGISQDTKAVINLNCAQNIEQNINLKNDLSTELDNQLKAYTGALTANDSNTQTINNLKTEIVNNIDLNTFSSCVLTSISVQQIQVGKVKISNCPPQDPEVNFKNFSQKIINEQVLNCIQKNSQLNELSTKLDTAVKNIQSATSASFWDTNTIIMIAVVVVGVCLLLSSGYAMYSFTSQKRVSNVVYSVPRQQSVASSSYFPSRMASIDGTRSTNGINTGLFLEGLKNNLQTNLNLQNLSNQLKESINLEKIADQVVKKITK